MAFTYPLPSTVSVRNLLGSLLDKPLMIENGTPLEIKPQPSVTVAVYAADDGTVAAVVVCDIEFAARIGAAMTLVPRNLVEESIQQRHLQDNLMENFREIMNICTSLFYLASTPHVTLKKVFMSHEGLPRDVMILSRRPAARLDLNIEVPGYGPGRISIMVNKRLKK